MTTLINKNSHRFLVPCFTFLFHINNNTVNIGIIKLNINELSQLNIEAFGSHKLESKIKHIAWGF